MRVSGVHHTSYTVANLERSLEFYCDLLGCEVIWRREITDRYFRAIVAFSDSVVNGAQLRIPGSDHILELFEYVQPRGQIVDMNTNNPGNSHLCFLVDDLQVAYEELSAAGVKFSTPRCRRCRCQRRLPGSLPRRSRRNFGGAVSAPSPMTEPRPSPE